MSLNLTMSNARLTVLGYGWDDESIDAGTATTEAGQVFEDVADDSIFDFPDGFDWDEVAEDSGIELGDGYYEDDDGNVYTDEDGDGIFEDEDGNEYDGSGTYYPSSSERTAIQTQLGTLANDEEAIYGYMTDHSDSTGMPARIIITQDPDTVDYDEGDTIDFTGIVVCAYASATTRTPFIREAWDGPRHNQVPFDDLTFPVTIATAEDS